TSLNLPGPQTLKVSSNRGAVAFTAAASGGNWLAVSPDGATTPGSLSVTVNPARLALGSYTGAIVLTAPGIANSPLSVPVKLNVTRGQLSPPAYGVAPDTIAVGSGNTPVTVFGTNFSSNATVQVNGIAVPTAWLDANTLSAVI